MQKMNKKLNKNFETAKVTDTFCQTHKKYWYMYINTFLDTGVKKP